MAVTANVPVVLPAEYRPLAEMVPPLADQVTLLFELPVTEAENCWVEPLCTEAEVGLIATLTVCGTGLVGLEPGLTPVQPPKSVAESKQRRKAVARGEYPSAEPSAGGTTGKCETTDPSVFMVL